MQIKLTELAELKEDGEIAVNVQIAAVNLHGQGNYILQPGTKEYETLKLRFNLTKPGDSRVIDSENRDGLWIDLDMRPFACSR